MEAGLLVTSGTQGNLVALLAQTTPGQKVILEADAHLFWYERGGLARVAGLLPHALAGRQGAMNLAEVEAAIWPENVHHAPTGILALENTHNRAGGTCLSKEHTRAICEVAHRHGLPVHVDGARVFNAAVALGLPVRELVAPVDSLTFCLSKGLGAPIGSVLCGTREMIAHARGFRKMLGGGMRQAGIIAAAGLVALEHELPRLHEDHENAQRLALTLAALPGVKLDLTCVQTNLVFFELDREDLTAAEFCARLADYDIRAAPWTDTSLRFVTHRDISRQDTEAVCLALREVLG